MRLSRFFATAFVLTILLISFLSCNEKKDNVNLTILGEDSSNLKAMQALKDKYEKENNVKIEFKPNSFEDAFSKSNLDFANKTGLYDVVLQYNFSLTPFVKNNYVHTLDELQSKIPDKDREFEKDLFPNVWEEVGHFYKNAAEPSDEMIKIGYPFAANTMVLVYNKEMFENPENKEAYKKQFNENLDVPKDLEKFKQIAAFFTKPDKNQHGVVLQGASGGWLYYEWVSFLQGFDGKVMDKERGWQGDKSTQVNVDSEKAIKTTEFLKSLKPYNAGGYTTIDAGEQRKLMKDGNIAMAIMWSDYLYDLIDGGKSQKFGFAPTPGKLSPIAGGSFYINKQSKHPDEALKYVISLLQKENQVELMKNGLCSPIKSSYDDPEVQKIPYTRALKESLDRAVYAFEAGPDSDVVSQKITNYFQKYWNDEITAEKAMKNAQAEIVEERTKIFSD